MTAKDDCTDLIGTVPVKQRKKPTGRPSSYNEATADRICELLMDGWSLRKICERDDMPAKITVLKWLGQQPSFAAQYAAAREAQADALADDTLAIADDKTLDPQDRRVRIDTRKWLAGKLRPKKYGDKLLVGEDADNPVSKPTIELDVVKLAQQMREARQLAAPEQRALPSPEDDA